MNTQDFPRKARSSSMSRIQGPVTAPSWMKENQNSEFRVIHILHLTKLLYIVETQEKQEFQAFPAQKP